jgi:hypothetical protein
MNQSNFNNNNKDANGNPSQGSSQFDYGMSASQFGQGGGGNGGDNSQFNGAGGEFGTGFGGTNAVSQIFKQGGLADEDKKRRMMIGGAAAAAILACAGLLLWFSWEDFFGGETTPEGEVTDGMKPATDAAAIATEAPAVAPSEVVAEATPEAAPAVLAEQPAPPAEAGGSYTYNEMDGGPLVPATDGAVIEVARRADFADAYILGRAKGGQLRIPNPPPGKIYWREQGGTASNEMSIGEPESLGVSFSPPGSVANGAQLTWSASGTAGFFRIEFATDASFNNVAAYISTGQNAAAVKDVAAGQYHVRVGGLNLKSGKWEYSGGSAITVQ